LPPVSTHDKDVFSFYRDGTACLGVPEVLQRYREIAAGVRLSGTICYQLLKKLVSLVQWFINDF
jgi:E3 ubiquitin-protein ligase RGLG